jgi:glycogen(starch) synthase
MNRDMLAIGRRVIAEEELDLVHGHDWLVGKAGAALAREARLPLAVTVHATEYGRHQGWVNKHPQRFIHRAEGRFIRAADRVITCSSYMRDHVADVFTVPEERVTVIPNGIDPADLRPMDDLAELRARFAAPDEQLVLLVGRLVYEKGFHVALDALAPLVERRGDVRFVVAGSGTAAADLEAQAKKLGLADAGTFLGWIGDDVLHSLYSIADLTVVPSIYEPFGLVALEAMASGCPCIVADTGGLREVAGDVGLRFRSQDARGLGRLIEQVLTDAALRDRLVTEASEHVLRFDWAEIAEETAGLYAELGRGHRPARLDVAPSSL